MTQEALSNEGSIAAQAPMEQHLGVTPAQFTTTADKAGLEALCRFAAAAYRDNPLPSAFKDRVFARLSQAAGVRYCLTRHVRLLLGDGTGAGEEAIIALLDRPFVAEDGVTALIGSIAASNSGELLAGSCGEAVLIDALALIFTYPRTAVALANALTSAVGAERYAQMATLLSYVRAEHFWALGHPDLSGGDDLALIERTAPALAARLNAVSAASVARESGHDDAVVRGHSELQRLLAYDAFGIMALARDGRLIAANDRLLAKIGRSRADLTAGALDWVGLAAPEQAASSRDQLTALVATGHLGPVEMQFLLPGGARKWVMLAGRELRDGTLVAFAIDLDNGKRAEAALAESEARHRALIEGIPQLVWRAVDGGEWTWSSPQWSEFTGLSARDSLGFGWEAAVHPSDRSAARAFWQSAERTGRLEMESRILHAATGEYRWFATRAMPVRDEAGAITEWLGTSTDVHDLRMMQERYVRLTAELQHSARNILSVIRSVFMRTAETTPDRGDMIDHFRGRLDALARTQVTVTRHPDGFADLEAMVRDELIGLGLSDAGRVTVDGPDVALPLAIAESMALAVHELTTNALKYGALKGNGASIDIRWRVEVDHGGARTLDFTWTERGVPTVSTNPSHEGFGREWIEQALPSRHNATTSLAFRGGGIHCAIRLPLPQGDG